MGFRGGGTIRYAPTFLYSSQSVHYPIGVRACVLWLLYHAAPSPSTIFHLREFVWRLGWQRASFFVQLIKSRLCKYFPDFSPEKYPKYLQGGFCRGDHQQSRMQHSGWTNLSLTCGCKRAREFPLFHRIFVELKIVVTL